MLDFLQNKSVIQSFVSAVVSPQVYLGLCDEQHSDLHLRSVTQTYIQSSGEKDQNESVKEKHHEHSEKGKLTFLSVLMNHLFVLTELSPVCR